MKPSALGKRHHFPSHLQWNVEVFEAMIHYQQVTIHGRILTLKDMVILWCIWNQILIYIYGIWLYLCIRCCFAILSYIYIIVYLSALKRRNVHHHSINQNDLLINQHLAGLDQPHTFNPFTCPSQLDNSWQKISLVKKLCHPKITSCPSHKSHCFTHLGAVFVYVSSTS